MATFDPEQYGTSDRQEFRPEKPQGFRSTDVYANNGVYLKYQDLETWAKATGRAPRRVVVIKDWGVVEMISNFEESKGKKKQQVVINFDVPEGDVFHGKWLGLNVTNDQRIRALTGTDDPAIWVGHAIQLLVSETTRTNGGPKVPCIRVNEGLIWTPEQVKAEERKQVQAQPRKQMAPPPSVVSGSGSGSMTRVQDAFDMAVPPDGPDHDERDGTVDEPFRDRF